MPRNSGLRAVAALAVTATAGLALVVLELPGIERVSAQTGAKRLAVVISDLHLGVGRDSATGQWHPLEDFRWRDEFAAFLRAVDQSGKGAADLILNGDTFELWQSLGKDCQYQDLRLGCTEADALARLERVLKAHAAEVGDLAAFLKAGTNRVVFVPGDHDAALLFPSVASRVVAALEAPGRVEVAVRGYWLSSDGAVYAEHGHQFDDEAYRFAGWPEPFIRQGGRTHLERTAGEQLVQSVYNGQESRHPLVDNFSEQGAGLNYAIAADPSAFPVDRVGPALRFFLSRTSWQQFRQNMDEGDIEPPVWDLPAIRKAGTSFFVESLPTDDRFRALAESAAKEGRLQLDPAALTEQELTIICDHRAALRRSRRRLERSLTQLAHVGPSVAECPRTLTTRGSAFDYFWESRDRRFTARAAQVRAAAQGAASARFFVFGHTHLPDYGFVSVRGAEAPVMINSGAFQRTLTPFQAEGLMKDRTWTVAELLRQMQPEQLPGCYGVVWIDPNKPLLRPTWVADGINNDPNPRFRTWREDGKFGQRLDRDAYVIASVADGRRGTGCPN